MNNKISSTLVLNQLKTIFDANEKALGEAQLNKEYYVKAKLNSRRSVYIFFGKLITELMDLPYPHYDARVLKSPIKLDLDLENLQSMLRTEAYRVSAFEDDLDYIDSVQYKINAMRARNTSLLMIANKWLPAIAGKTASKHINIPALYAYLPEDIRMNDFKESMQVLKQAAEEEGAPNVYGARSALHHIGSILQEENFNPSWERIFSFEKQIKDFTLKSDRILHILYGTMLKDHVFEITHHEKMSDDDVIFIKSRLLTFEAICTSIIPQLRAEIDYNQFFISKNKKEMIKT